MNRVVKKILYMCSALMFLLTSCVRDGLEPCEPDGPRYFSYIQLKADYNISGIDQISEVERVEVFMFDENEVFLGRLEHKPDPSNPIMGIPEAYEKACYFVVLGADEDGYYNYSVSNLTEGISTKDEFTVSIDKGTLEAPFWHTYAVEKPNTPIQKNDIIVVTLIKYTKKINVLVRYMDGLGADNSLLLPEEFDINLNAPYGTYDADNNVKGNVKWDYYSKGQYNNNTGVNTDLYTSRLFVDIPNVLSILYNDEEIFNEDLNETIRKVKEEEVGDRMTMQEYMDKQDQFSIEIGIEPRDTENGYTGTLISINDWVARDQPIGK